ncbi:MAG: GntR family transcriptional regulator [Oscillospiraceae bacterium]|nr:GntR family transcriptional regulator [Oscillospiraceae bacterium]
MIDKNSDMPIYKQIYNTLYDEIVRGAYDEQGKLPCERELKRLFGVERNTVRKALKLLSDDGLIIKVPGYGTKIALNKKNPKNILFITRQDYFQQENSEYFHMKLIENLEKILSLSNYNLIFKSADDYFDLIKAISYTEISAIIFDSYNKSSLYKTARSIKIPCVSINHYTPEVTSIVSNNSDSSYKVVKMLMEAGHRKIAFIAGKENYQTTIERLNGIQSYYARNKLHFDKKYIIQGDWSFDSGVEAGEKFLAMSAEERPTAVFAFNDDMAYGCLSCFEKRGIAVPDEISLIGFDKSDKYASILRPINTVDVNIDVIVKYALWYLMGCLENKDPGAGAIVKIQIDTVIYDNKTVKVLSEL